MEGLTSFLQVGGFVIAMLTIYRALSEYGKNNLFQRAKILESLIDKFKDKKLYVAKRLLDDFIEVYYEDIDFDKIDKPTPKGIRNDATVVHSKLKIPLWTLSISVDSDGKQVMIYKKDDMVCANAPSTDQRIIPVIRKALPKVRKFTFISLDHLLRDHKNSVIDDPEVYFRDSFDQLLDFYSLLIYYLRNEIITIREVQAHFLFHLISVKQCTPLINYISIYYEEENFQWLFRQLPERMTEKRIPAKKTAVHENPTMEKLQQIQAIIDDKEEELK